MTASTQQCSIEEKPRVRWWLLLALVVGGFLIVPASAQDAPTTCDYSQGHLNNGWGWDESSNESCEPVQARNRYDLTGPHRRDPQPSDPHIGDPTMVRNDQAVTTTAAQSASFIVGTCDYSKAHHYDGYGWDEVNGISCQPLDGWVGTEYVAPEPGSPEDTCDYSKSHFHDGYGWDEINGISCEPMAMRIAKAAAKNTLEPPAPPPAVSAPVHPDDWDGDGVLDPVDNFPFDPSRS